MKNKEEVMVVQQLEDKELAKKLWEVYLSSFADSDNFCAQEQLCYDESTLHEACGDKDYWKFILLADDVPVGFCLLTNNLRKARIAYCNDRFYQKKFPHYVAQGRLYYVTAICALPEMQKRGIGIKMLEEVCKFIYENKAMVTYDYSETKNPWLTQLIIKVGSTLGWQVIEIPLDKQCYTSLYYLHDGKPS